MSVTKELLKQWQDMLARGTIPVIELPTTEGYLVAELHADNYGLRFEFDQQHPTYFDGAVKGAHGQYVVRWDKYFTNLHYYLEMVMDNLYEGYIIPNNLMPTGDDR